MQAEYLIFNIIVAAGPLGLSFDRKVHYFRLWKYAIAASLLSAVPFVAWDIAANEVFWWFNPQFTLPPRLLGLPLEEWLFFLTVPFACIFIWEVLNAYWTTKDVKARSVYTILIIAFAITGLAAFVYNLYYTATASLVLAAIIFFDHKSSVRMFEKAHTYILLGIVSILMLIFNGYLTSRPVVLYDPAYQLDFRVYTIPLEDFLFGYGHILLSVVAYELLKGKKR